MGGPQPRPPRAMCTGSLCAGDWEEVLAPMRKHSPKVTRKSLAGSRGLPAVTPASYRYWCGDTAPDVQVAPSGIWPGVNPTPGLGSSRFPAALKMRAGRHGNAIRGNLSRNPAARQPQFTSLGRIPKSLRKHSRNLSSELLAWQGVRKSECAAAAVSSPLRNLAAVGLRSSRPTQTASFGRLTAGSSGLAPGAVLRPLPRAPSVTRGSGLARVSCPTVTATLTSTSLSPTRRPGARAKAGRAQRQRVQAASQGVDLRAPPRNETHNP
jgi:hypothetical protein